MTTDEEIKDLRKTVDELVRAVNLAAQVADLNHLEKRVAELEKKIGEKA